MKDLLQRNYKHLPPEDEFIQIATDWFCTAQAQYHGNVFSFHRHLSERFPMPAVWCGNYKGGTPTIRADLYGYTKQFSLNTWVSLAEITPAFLTTVLFYSPLYYKKDDYLKKMFLASPTLLQQGVDYVNGRLHHNAIPGDHQLVFKRLTLKYNELAALCITML